MNWHMQRNGFHSPWLSYMSKTWQMKQLCLKQNTIAHPWHFHIGMFYITLNHYSKSFFHLIYINSSLYIRSVLPALGTSHCCRLSNSVRNFLHCHGNGAVSYDRTHSIGIVDLSQYWAVVVSNEHARPQQPLDLMDRSRMTITGVPHYTVDGVSYQSVKIYGSQYFIKIKIVMFIVFYFSHPCWHFDTLVLFQDTCFWDWHTTCTVQFIDSSVC